MGDNGMCVPVFKLWGIFQDSYNVSTHCLSHRKTLKDPHYSAHTPRGVTGCAPLLCFWAGCAKGSKYLPEGRREEGRERAEGDDETSSRAEWDAGPAAPPLGGGHWPGRPSHREAPTRTLWPAGSGEVPAPATCSILRAEVLLLGHRQTNKNVAFTNETRVPVKACAL